MPQESWAQDLCYSLQLCGASVLSDAKASDGSYHQKSKKRLCKSRGISRLREGFPLLYDGPETRAGELPFGSARLAVGRTRCCTFAGDRLFAAAVLALPPRRLHPCMTRCTTHPARRSASNKPRQAIARSGRRPRKANCINRIYGAGDGNRTHVRSLGNVVFAIALGPGERGEKNNSWTI
jgi:hypothetical protein